MKKIIIIPILIILLGLPYLYHASGANSVTGPYYNPQYRSMYATISLDQTNDSGDECVNVDGYIYKTVMVDVTAGTITYDVEWSNNGTFYDDLDGATSKSADESFEFVTAAKQACVHVSACTDCEATAYVYGQGYSRDFIKAP